MSDILLSVKDSGQPSTKSGADSAIDQKSVLGSFVDRAQSLVWDPQSAEQIEIRDEVSHYVTSFAKTGMLFAGGKLGRIGTAALFGLDQSKASDDYSMQSLDFGLGVIKGTAMRGVFKYTPQGWEAPTKGIALGLSSRFLDGVTNRNNYTGDNFVDSTKNMLNVTVAQTLNGRAMVSDALIFGAAHGLSRATGALTPSVGLTHQALKTASVGGIFGLSSGAAGEMQRQEAAGENFDLRKVLTRAALQGGVDAGAAGLAGRYNGMMARRNDMQSFVPKERTAQTLVVPTSEISAVPEHLNLVPKYPSNLPKLTELLQKPQTQTSSGKGQPAEALATSPPADYHSYRAALPDTTQTSNVYKPKGFPEISIEALHDARLNEVRTLRQNVEEARDSVTKDGGTKLKAAQAALDAHGLKDALLPEELLPLMAQLPEMGMVKRVIISPERSPEDPFFARKHGMPGFTAAAEVTKDGVVTLFQPNRSVLDFTKQSPLRVTMIHEWSHLFRWKLGDPASTVYDRATALEVDQRATAYSRVSPSEDMARNVADLLHGDAKTMTATATANPLRSAILSAQLQKVLAETPVSDRSKYHQNYVDRVAHIEKVATPLAQQLLIEQISKQSGSQSAASRLLLDLGWGSKLADIGSVQRLELGQAKLTDADLARIPSGSLTHLDLTGVTGLTPKAAETLALMQNLRRLDAAHTTIGPELLKTLTGIPTIEQVDLRAAGIPIKDIKGWNATHPKVSVRY